jgi:transcriptional regulator with XRE-family HTH domain
LGKKIARRRDALGLSQADLAAKIQAAWPKCTSGDISKLENEQRPAIIKAIHRLQAIAKALDMTLDELLEEE